MILLWLPVGLILPTLSGWLLLRLLEGHTLVLFRLERWILGFLLGLTLAMFATFLAHISGLILFTRFGFLSVQITLTVLLALARLLQWKLSPHPTPYPLPPHPSKRSPLWIKLTLSLALLWTTIKIVSGSLILITTPSFFDDTLKNWNERAKIFTLTGTLDATPDATGKVSTLSGYPPTVSLVKTCLTTLAGEPARRSLGEGGWHEGLVNSIHALWFLTALALLFYALRRRTSGMWALTGTLILSSLPLYLFQGVNAYADVFLSAHLLAAASLLSSGLTEMDAYRRQSFFRLGAFATALIIFTKNEALLLYLPLLLALLAGGLVFLRRSRPLPSRDLWAILLWFAVWLIAIGLPWLLFKWTHGLVFGNSKALSSGYVFGWQPNVLYTLWVNIFFEGNWHLLFPFFFFLLFLCWRQAFRSTLSPIVLFVLASLLFQLILFLLTSLSAEALRQTGTGRGLVQLAPLVVLVTTVLLRDAMKRE